MSDLYQSHLSADNRKGFQVSRSAKLDSALALRSAGIPVGEFPGAEVPDAAANRSRADRTAVTLGLELQLEQSALTDKHAVWHRIDGMP